MRHVSASPGGPAGDYSFITTENGYVFVAGATPQVSSLYVFVFLFCSCLVSFPERSCVRRHSVARMSGLFCTIGPSVLMLNVICALRSLNLRLTCRQLPQT